MPAVSASQHAQALRFIEAVPEAQSFSVCLCTQEKRAIVNRAACSRGVLLNELRGWMGTNSVHFFLRPQLRNLVFLDLDNFQGSVEDLLKLKPRILVSSSPGNYQAWLTVNEELCGQTAVWVMKELTAALGADQRSAKPTQQGRLPGTISVKPGKGNEAVLLHAEREDMDQEEFLRITGRKSLKVVANDVSVTSHSAFPYQFPHSGNVRSNTDKVS